MIREGAERFGVELLPEALDRIGRFLDLLGVWNRRLRLTGTLDSATIVRKHVVDSLAPVPELPSAGPVVDVGSGAGFPGIVIACVRPEVSLVLLEVRRRRVSFLRDAIRSIPLPAAEALEMRAEDAAHHPGLAGRASAVIARALRLEVFLGLAAPLLASGGLAIAMQTPRTLAGAAASAGRRGLRLLATHPYTLPGGERRSLALFTPSLPPVP